MTTTTTNQGVTMNRTTRTLAALAAALVLVAVMAPASNAARGHRYHRHHHAQAQRLHRAHQATSGFSRGERAPSSVPFQAPVCADMWKAPNSARADGCRAYGWYITAALVVSPRDEVWHSTLPHCADATGSTGPLPCSWNFDKANPDDSIGKSYWIGADGTARTVSLVRL